MFEHVSINENSSINLLSGPSVREAGNQFCRQLETEADTAATDQGSFTSRYGTEKKRNGNIYIYTFTNV